MLQFLLSLADESNHDKIERLYTKYHDDMIRYSQYKFKVANTGNVNYNSEDAVQNTFTKISLYINNIDFSRNEQEIRAYIFSILNNEICNLLKEESTLELIEDSVVSNEKNLIDEICQKETFDNIVKAIESLDINYSFTLYHVICKEMTVKEISQMMGITENTVYSRLHRGLILLKKFLGGQNINANK